MTPADVQLENLLDAKLASYGQLLVAYSGGVDSSYLAYRAQRVLGERSVAVLADSPSLARAALTQAQQFADTHGLTLRVIRTDEMDNPKYRDNQGDRCYHCKSALFSHMHTLASQLGVTHLAYGAIVDDLGDHRPGQKAAQQFSVCAPLQEVGLDKAAIRRLSKALGLNSADLPSSPCLSSRLAYGEKVTVDKLAVIEQAEIYLRQLGVSDCRLRHHGDIARVEIPASEILAVLAHPSWPETVAKIRQLGFLFVTIDAEGLKSGSLNRALRVVPS